MSTPEMPAPHTEYFEQIDPVRLEPQHRADHPPRILLLYGSLRPRSFSRLLVLEAERILQAMSAETRIFDPAGLPVADSVPPPHTRRCRNYGNCRSGLKDRSGAALSGTAT